VLSFHVEHGLPFPRLPAGLHSHAFLGSLSHESKIFCAFIDYRFLFTCTRIAHFQKRTPNFLVYQVFIFLSSASSIRVALLEVMTVIQQLYFSKRSKQCGQSHKTVARCYILFVSMSSKIKFVVLLSCREVMDMLILKLK
jgi:hypothetical protein